ncbi:hypothetical protein QBC32DRAFT_68841 [Pseudoneurospora amorphoporcata]|uniref:Uncharacterized protein n=1 Tax=Pseudoneurospora amorphoporcata TaxID=241081 RepID=A0AAN6NZH3_9PEZI|nr:hypothetical protein QBC32DRAFT_68841 [Pseudoneurospora amorphoporcata]
MKYLRELTEDGKLMSATSFPDVAKPKRQLTSPWGLKDFVDNPEDLDEWARNHRCWREEPTSSLRLKFECSHKPAQPPSKHPKPLRPLVRDLTWWWV